MSNASPEIAAAIGLEEIAKEYESLTDQWKETNEIREKIAAAFENLRQRAADVAVSPEGEEAKRVAVACITASVKFTAAKVSQ